MIILSYVLNKPEKPLIVTHAYMSRITFFFVTVKITAIPAITLDIPVSRWMRGADSTSKLGSEKQPLYTLCLSCQESATINSLNWSAADTLIRGDEGFYLLLSSNGQNPSKAPFTRSVFDMDFGVDFALKFVAIPTSKCLECLNDTFVTLFTCP